MISYRMLDQVRIDNGREFYLMLGFPELHNKLRKNQSMSSYSQVQCRKIYALFVCLICFFVCLSVFSCLSYILLLIALF